MSHTEAELRTLKVPELKALLSQKGLAVSGKKEELVARLLASTDGAQKGTSGGQDNINTVNASNPNNGTSVDSASKPAEDLYKGDEDEFAWEGGDVSNYDFNDDIDDLISSPTHSVSSAKEKSPDKNKIESSKELQHKDNKDNNQVDVSSSSMTSNSKDLDIIVKPTGFQCKRITYNAQAPPSMKQSPDMVAEAERRKKRAERFGVAPTESDKKLERAARFGITVTDPVDAPLKAERPPTIRKASSTIDDGEKLKKRAERFGLVADSSTTSPAQTNGQSASSSLPNDEEKKKQRAQRFGLTANNDDEDKKRKRGERFGSSTISKEEEEKLRKRAQRFGLDIADPAKGTSGKASTDSSKATTSTNNSNSIPATSSNSVSEEEKKRKRAERFANTAVEPQNKKVKA